MRATEEQLASVRDPEQLSRHFEDESDLNELRELVVLLRERLGRFASATAGERRGLLADRAALIQHADALAGAPGRERSPRVREAFEQLRSEWAAVRGELLVLAA